MHLESQRLQYFLDALGQRPTVKVVRFKVGIVCNQVAILSVIHFKERIRRNRDKVRISEQIEEIRNDAFFGCFVDNCPGIEALLFYVRVPKPVDIIPSPSKVLELC